MRKVAIGLCAVGLMNASVLAGVVNFTRVTPVPIDVPDVVRPEQVVIDVQLQATGAVTTISGGDIVIGSPDTSFSFAYSPDFIAAMTAVSPQGPAGIYSVKDILVGGSNTTTGAGTALTLGRITVDTSLLPNGVYHIGVSTAVDGFSGIFRGLPGQPFVSEELSGSHEFTVVPEPATLSLLGLGLFGLIRRRFAA